MKRSKRRGKLDQAKQRTNNTLVNEKCVSQKRGRPPLFRGRANFEEQTLSPTSFTDALYQYNALWQDLLHLVHDHNHFGAARTHAIAQRHFQWKGLRDHIKHFVVHCPTYQLQKPKTTANQQPLFPETRFYPYPFHIVVLDEVEGLTLTSKGHNALLTVVDRFTKFAIYIAINSSWSAFRQAQCLLDNQVHRYHTPQCIHTDNGQAYRKLFKAFCTTIGDQHSM